MKKVLSKLEYIVAIAIIALSFFPWLGLFNFSAIDITRAIVENITSVAKIDEYAIALTLIMSVVTVVMGLLKKDSSLYQAIAFSAPVVGFVYGMVVSSRDYFSSMELAYIIVVLLGLTMMLKKMGIVKI